MEVDLNVLFSDYLKGKIEELPNREGLVALFGHRCRKETKERLHRRLSSPGLIQGHGIFHRVMFDVDSQEWSYCAGQSYPDEIRTVRELLLK